LIDRSRNYSELDVRNFTGAAGETDYYLVVAEVRERLAVKKVHRILMGTDLISAS
jgi:hypothetical protein